MSYLLSQCWGLSRVVFVQFGCSFEYENNGCVFRPPPIHSPFLPFLPFLTFSIPSLSLPSLPPSRSSSTPPPISPFHSYRVSPFLARASSSSQPSIVSIPFPPPYNYPVPCRPSPCRPSRHTHPVSSCASAIFTSLLLHPFPPYYLLRLA